jgi:hypothetical protein
MLVLLCPGDLYSPVADHNWLVARNGRLGGVSLLKVGESEAFGHVLACLYDGSCTGHWSESVEGLSQHLIGVLTIWAGGQRMVNKGQDAWVPQIGEYINFLHELVGHVRIIATRQEFIHYNFFPCFCILQIHNTKWVFPKDQNHLCFAEVCYQIRQQLGRTN